MRGVLESIELSTDGCNYTRKAITTVGDSYSEPGGGRGIRTPEGLHLSGFQVRLLASADVRQSSRCIDIAGLSSANVGGSSP